MEFGRGSGSGSLSAVVLVLMLVATPALAPPMAQARDATGVSVASDIQRHRAALRDPTKDVRYVHPSSDISQGELVKRPAADVVAARVKYGHRGLLVKMRFLNLRRIGWQYFEALITTPAGGSLFGFSVASSFKHRSGRTDDFGGRFECERMRHKINFRMDFVRMWIPRPCMRKPLWVKVELNNSLTTRASAADDGMNYQDNPFNRRAWADTTTRRLYRA